MASAVEMRGASARAAPLAQQDVRERWRMGPEARGLVLISAVLTAFGLAVLYSASAFVAMNDKGSSTFFLTHQATGVLVGIVVFAVAAKFDADTLRDWAWPIMWFTIATMFAVLVLPNR
ncbi:MAG TPA: FtsW/RodA/SpoVE family cell cycle protein, partial [Gemmatimonadaceae bacterium]|nr:FtsW/RodA/SpoVE family cell cycle protein [Gemmatimonadaceae bacterium]